MTEAGNSPKSYEEMISEFNEKLAEFESKINSITVALPEITAAYTESRQCEEELWEEFQKKLAEQKRMSEAIKEQERSLLLQQKELQAQLALILQQKRNLELELEAQEKLSALEKKMLHVLEKISGWSKARTYQQRDIFYAAAAFDQGLSGILNALDMSLGKTFEAAMMIGALTGIPGDPEHVGLFKEKYGYEPKILWLTKKALIKSNMREIQKWNPGQKIVAFDPNLKITDVNVRNMMVKIAVDNGAMVICNYEALGTTPALKETQWDVIFVDEVHRLKGGANPAGPTGIWKNTKEVCENAKFYYFLSGSPIMNHPREMWAYLNIFDPVRFPSVKRFEREYCYGYGEGLVDFDLLIRALSKQVIRRKKTDDDVEVDLPDLEFEYVLLEHTEKQAALYNKMRDEFFIELDKDEEAGTILSATAIIAKLTRLRQINVWAGGLNVKRPDGTTVTISDDLVDSVKVDEAFDKIVEITNQGDNVVVFTAQFNGPIHELAKRLKNNNITYRVLDGDTVNYSSDYEREFQNNEFSVFLINMKTGSEGLNLHRSKDWPGGASYGIFLDLWYNPETNNQGRDRIWRPGQTEHPVIITVLKCENSVDAFIEDLLEKKEAMIEGIMNDKTLRKAGEWKEILRGLI